MKCKIKCLLGYLGIILLYILIFSWDNDKFDGTILGNVLDTVGILFGLGICGFLIFVFASTIYISIRDHFRRKIREEARRVVAEEKYLERIRNKENQHEEN
jgi:hypothetical protein